MEITGDRQLFRRGEYLNNHFGNDVIIVEAMMSP